MASVFDVDEVEVIQQGLSMATMVTPGVGTTEITVPGPQGAPGLQNAFTGLTSPAEIPGEEWSMAEKGYIWIEVDV